MHKEFLFFIKYPYTAGVIATVWISSAFLLLISDGLDPFKVVMVNVFTTVIIAAIGFGGRGNA